MLYIAKYKQRNTHTNTQKTYKGMRISLPHGVQILMCPTQRGEMTVHMSSAVYKEEREMKRWAHHPPTPPSPSPPCFHITKSSSVQHAWWQQLNLTGATEMGFVWTPGLHNGSVMRTCPHTIILPSSCQHSPHVTQLAWCWVLIHSACLHTVSKHRLYHYTSPCFHPNLGLNWNWSLLVSLIDAVQTFSV